MKTLIKQIEEDGYKALEKYKDSLTSFSDVLTIINKNQSTLKLVDLIDNAKNSDESISRVCANPKCLGKIRYEYIIEKDGKKYAYGKDCVKKLLNLDIETSLFLTKLVSLKEKQDEVKKTYDKTHLFGDLLVSNKKVIEKLETLNDKGILIFEVLYKLSCIRELEEDELAFIWFASKEKINENTKYTKIIQKLTSSSITLENRKHFAHLYRNLMLNKSISEKDKEMIDKCYKDYRANMKCPFCGGELLQKTSKYGKFLGCSNYKLGCKYTKNIDEYF